MFIFLCRFVPGGLALRSAGLKKGKKAPGEKLPALTPVPDGVEFGQRHEPVNTIPTRRIADSSSINAVNFIRTHHEEFTVVAMYVCNPD